MKSNPSTTLKLFYTTAALFGASLLHSTTAFALEHFETEKYFRFYGGISRYSEGEDRRLDYGKGNFDRFTDNSEGENVFQYGLGAGFIIPMDKGEVEIGLGWYGEAEHDYKGYIDQYGKTSLRDFKYSYGVKSYRMMLDGRWIIPFNSQFESFITGGIGVGRNKFDNYSYQSLDPNDLSPKPQFDSQTTTTFAWQLGAGVSYEFIPDWQASVYYLYINNGKAEADADNEPFSLKYETDDLTSHSLMFSLNNRF